MPYLRTWQVVTARPLSGSFFRDSPASVLTIRDARVTFRVEKSLESEPNTASVEIYNLKEGTRGEFEQRPLALRLFAGHDGTLKRLFSGDVFWATSKREGPEWITLAEAGDGQRAIRQAKVNKSYKAGLKKFSALRDLAQSMGLSVAGLDLQYSDLRQEFGAGLVLEGNSAAQLTRLLASSGLRWSIQDGRLQILQRRGVGTETALLISQETGLQGSPEFGAPKVERDPPTLHFKTLLKPELTPGRLCILESKTAKGRFRIDRVRHVGDSHGQDWYSDVEASA